MAAGDEPHVRYEKKDRVAYVTLNRPDVLNAMDLHMHAELGAVWDDFAADDELWLAVLTGAGDRAFSTGQDLKERAEPDRAQPMATRLGAGIDPGGRGSRNGSRSPSRSSPEWTDTPSAAASSWRLPATSSWPPTARCSPCRRRGSVWSPAPVR